ncbi:hypothetical protein EVAR_32878_1 [Eumeta japonica]|uniref:Uncharacterized protein n=1 Tax=Eumeta variegata TaxID=151549 RepID=A0A4C1VRQ6_EUMVA|nr:hypothetical protein EVAR_32878_1 [Eumeta japonica]
MREISTVNFLAPSSRAKPRLATVRDNTFHLPKEGKCGVVQSEAAAIVTRVAAVAGGEADLPCDSRPPQRNDSLLLVVWYRDDLPVYRNSLMRALASNCTLASPGNPNLGCTLNFDPSTVPDYCLGQTIDSNPGPRLSFYPDPVFNFSPSSSFHSADRFTFNFGSGTSYDSDLHKIGNECLCV